MLSRIFESTNFFREFFSIKGTAKCLFGKWIYFLISIEEFHLILEENKKKSVDSEFGKICHEHVNEFKYLGTSKNCDLIRPFQRTLKIIQSNGLKRNFFYEFPKKLSIIEWRGALALQTKS